MSNEDKTFELITKMYSEIRKGFKEMNERIDSLDNEVSNVKKIVINIENDHGQKLDALFDGYKQNSEKLTKIEEEVKKHDEFILRRIK